MFEGSCRCYLRGLASQLARGIYYILDARLEAWIERESFWEVP